MPPVEPVVESGNSIKIEDFEIISDNDNPSHDPLYNPPVGNEALLKEQEDENDKDQALNEVSGQVQNAIDKVNMSIETMDQGGMNEAADDARDAAAELNRIQNSM